MNMCIFIFIEIFLAVLNIRKVEVMNPFTRMKDWIRTIRTRKTKGNKQNNNNTPYKMHSLLTNESAHKDTHTHTYTKTLSLALPFIRNVQTFNFAILKHFLIFPLLHFFMSIFHLFWFVCVFPHSIVRYSFRSEYIRLLRTILFFFFRWERIFFHFLFAKQLRNRFGFDEMGCNFWQVERTFSKLSSKQTCNSIQFNSI